jgi:hypothetical protein
MTALIQICFKVFSPAPIHVCLHRKPDKLFLIIFGGAQLCPAQRDQPQQRGNDRCREITRRVWQEQRAAAGLTTQPRSWKKRRRAAAVHDAGAFADGSRTARSVLDCASPLALWADGRDARDNAKLFHFFDDEHFDWLAARHEFERGSRQWFIVHVRHA